MINELLGITPYLARSALLRMGTLVALLPVLNSQHLRQRTSPDRAVRGRG